MSEKKITDDAGNVWTKTDLFCVYCGKQELWEDAGHYDSEVGRSMTCIGCDSNFFTHAERAEPQQSRHVWPDLIRSALRRGGVK